MSNKSNESNVIDFNRAKQRAESQGSKKLKCSSYTTTLDKDILENMKNEFDSYFKKEKEVFNNGCSKD